MPRTGWGGGRYLMIWNQLLCDVCGMRSPGLTGRPRATLIRQIMAEEHGWKRIELKHTVRDVCDTCARMTHNEMAALVKHY